MPTRDITGQIFNWLTAIKRTRKYICGTTQEWIWLFKCKCGNEVEKRIGQVTKTTNPTKSCGCRRRQANNLAEINGNWSGNKIGLSGLHAWVRYRLKQPKRCQLCKKKKTMLDLANKGIYDRNLKNWEYLCRKCHMTSDGRLARLVKMKKRKGDKNPKSL